MKSVFDRNFKYYPAIDTDIRRTFRRVRRQRGEEAGEGGMTLPALDHQGKVLPLLQRRGFAE
jgi:hypothetical protein